MVSGSQFAAMRTVEERRQRAATTTPTTERSNAQSSTSVSDSICDIPPRNQHNASYAPSAQIRKQTQNVWTISRRIRVVKWMI